MDEDDGGGDATADSTEDSQERATDCFELVRSKGLDLRIPRICCLRPDFERASAPFRFWLFEFVVTNEVTDLACFFAIKRRRSASNLLMVLLWLLAAILSRAQSANSSWLSLFNSFDNS
jgi:hypothetical protein